MSGSITLVQQAASSTPVPGATSLAIYDDSSLLALSTKNSSSILLPISYQNNALATGSTSGAINTTETIITPPFIIPNTVANGAAYRLYIAGTCTSSHTGDTSTFNLRTGNAGTVAGDTTVIQAMTTTSRTGGTNTPFVIVWNIVFQGGVWNPMAFGYNAAGAVGIANVTWATAAATSATIGTHLEVSYVSSAVTTTCTFTQAVWEIVKW